MTPSLRARLEGGLVGMLVGDALGVPYEFHPPSAIPPEDRIEFTPPPGFPRAHPSVPPGTWSDDGAQALCVLASLLERDRLDLDDFAARMVRWRDEGYMAVDGRAFDIGVQTSRALASLTAGAGPRGAGPDGERDNGNGSLMRVLPLALWHRGSDAELASDAADQSRPTHGHVRSRVCCALYCLWARRLLGGVEDPWTSAVAALRGVYGDGRDVRALEELDGHVARGMPAGGSGYVLDTLHSARYALERPTYAEVVRGAIRLGRDTDTTACVAGGLAGVRDGIEGIPKRWRDALRGSALLTPLLEGLLARAARPGP
ncbi:MAG: ADP-ribosylglycohydrolase family protein [Planctomycetota bacterium]